jgi:hypothetical protein
MLPSSLNEKVYFNVTAVGLRRVQYQRLKPTQQPSALTSTIPKFCCSSPTGCSSSVPAYSNPSNVCTSRTIVYNVSVSAKSSIPHVSPTLQRRDAHKLTPRANPRSSMKGDITIRTLYLSQLSILPALRPESLGVITVDILPAVHNIRTVCDVLSLAYHDGVLTIATASSWKNHGSHCGA